MKQKIKTAVLVSGGVDSSVALRLLHDSGQHDLTVFYLKIWLEEELSFLGDCPWEDDLQMVRAVCEQIHVPMQIVSLQTDYRQRVVQYALEELRRGRTPSPDIFCNQRIKFGAFFEKIDDSFEKIATGHYAQIIEHRNVDSDEGSGQTDENDNADADEHGGVHRANNLSGENSASSSIRYELKRGPDPVKDQSYFLSHLSQAQLARALFPIGHLQKTEVRRLAEQYELPNRHRKDSQGICFLGKIKYSDFVRFHLGEKQGDIVEVETGKVLGPHRGFWFYTIGQRNGLNLNDGPWYVVRKDAEQNRVLVSHAKNFQQRARTDFIIENVHWIAGTPPSQEPLELQTKLRHGPELIDCAIRPLSEGRWHERIAQPDTGLATGQFSILYHRETCLGGGTICDIDPTY